MHEQKGTALRWVCQWKRKRCVQYCVFGSTCSLQHGTNRWDELTIT